MKALAAYSTTCKHGQVMDGPVSVLRMRLNDQQLCCGQLVKSAVAAPGFIREQCVQLHYTKSC